MESNDKKAYEKYEIVEISRKELKNAPYNPRILNDDARKKLRKNIKEVGLLNPPVWNVRTGNIVSGHQRISVLDGLHRNKEYTLNVAKVDLDEKTEKEQNIFMNNPEAQGEWDIQKLEELIKIDHIDIDLAGFDSAQVFQLFGDNPLIEQPEQLIELSNQLRETHERYKEVLKKVSARDDTDFYTVLIFKNATQRKKFNDTLGLPDNRYVDSKHILKFLDNQQSDE